MVIHFLGTFLLEQKSHQKIAASCIMKSEQHPIPLGIRWYHFIFFSTQNVFSFNCSSFFICCFFGGGVTRALHLLSFSSYPIWSSKAFGVVVFGPICIRQLFTMRTCNFGECPVKQDYLHTGSFNISPPIPIVQISSLSKIFISMEHLAVGKKFT